MAILVLIFIIFLVVAVGYAAVALISGKKPISSTEHIALALALGPFLTTVGVLLMHWKFDVSLTLPSITGFLLVSLGVLHFILHVTKNQLANRFVLPSVRSWSWVEQGLAVLLGLIIVSTASQNLFWPVTDWDALALYDFRGRVVAETGSFASGVELGYYFQYPPFTSLLHTFSYLTGTVYAKIWYSLLYASMVGLLYALLRRRTTRAVALLGALATAVSPYLFEHATVAYTNLSYTLFLGVGSLFIWEWVRTNAISNYIHGTLFVAAATWVRMTEPFWLISILFLLMAGIMLGKRNRSWIPLVLSVVGVVSILIFRQLWPAFVADVHTVVPTTDSPSLVSQSISSVVGYGSYLSVFSSTESNELLQRFSEVSNYLRAYVFEMFAPYAVGLVYVFGYAIYHRRVRWFEWGMLAGFVGLLWFGTFLFSFFDGSWDQIGGSAQRMSMFLLPLVLFLIFESKAWLQKK
jgi:hypothetical protein